MAVSTTESLYHGSIKEIANWVSKTIYCDSLARSGCAMQVKVVLHKST
jgi:hypothetical protein